MLIEPVILTKSMRQTKRNPIEDSANTNKKKYSYYLRDLLLNGKNENGWRKNKKCSRGYKWHSLG